MNTSLPNHIDLSVDDKEIVVGGKQLTDKHINYAGTILGSSLGESDLQ